MFCKYKIDQFIPPPIEVGDFLIGVLKFIGTGMGLFGQWIKWLLLTIVTLGIYGFWVNLKMRQWVVRNTVFDQQ